METYIKCVFIKHATTALNVYSHLLFGFRVLSILGLDIPTHIKRLKEINTTHITMRPT